MKFKKVFLIYILIVAVLLFALALYYHQKSNPFDLGARDSVELEQQLCEISGGIWKEFLNGCVDSCDLERNPERITCIQALTFGCDCGNNMCWNGNSCENN